MNVRERFATAADGTRLWWAAAGRGAPAVVLTDGIACSGWIWRDLLPRLSARHRVVHWNLRGHGRTGAPRDSRRCTIGDCADDLLRVMNAAGLDSAVLVGHSMGVQICLEAHRREPERVEALALLCGVPGHLLDHFHGSGLLARVCPFVELFVALAPGAVARAYRAALSTRFAVEFALAFEVNRKLLPREDLARFLAGAGLVDVRSYARLLASAALHDATDHLPDIRVPVLVVAGDRDTWTPFSLSLRMHEAIPGSELLVLPGGTHAGLLEHAELVAPRLERFLESLASRRRER